MKRALSLVCAAALPALALILAGNAWAGGHRSRLASRLTHSDAERRVDQQADGERWLADEHDGSDDRERHRRLVESAWRASAASLEVDGGRNGGISVTGWGRDSICVVARVEAQAGSMERARELASGVSIAYQGGRLAADGPETDDEESWSVMFDVLAPRTMALRLEAHNGPISVLDMNARIALETVNGPVALRGVSGDVRARTQNGPLTVRLTGARWRGAGLDASTQNGPVSLAVPRGYSCMLETGTINGPFNVDIPIVVQGRIDGHRRHLVTKLGGGGPSVRAITTNGPAVVSYAEEREAGGEEIEN